MSTNPYDQNTEQINRADLNVEWNDEKPNRMEIKRNPAYGHDYREVVPEFPEDTVAENEKMTGVKRPMTWERRFSIMTGFLLVVTTYFVGAGIAWWLLLGTQLEQPFLSIGKYVLAILILIRLYRFDRDFFRK